MKRSKFSEEQVIAILQEQEAGAKTADMCRRHGISSATFYAWKWYIAAKKANDGGANVQRQRIDQGVAATAGLLNGAARRINHVAADFGQRSVQVR